MLRIGLTLLGVAFLLSSCDKLGNLGGAGGNKAVDIKTDDQKFSYVIGQQIGNGLKSQNINVDVDVLAASIRDVMAGSPSRIDQAEMQQVMGRMQAKMMAKQMGAAKENKEKGDKFLAANKLKAGVTTTKSGLQYEVMTDGKGPIPKATDTVKVHYKGTLLDGSEFDSSYKRGQPAEFPVGGVIKGWTEALELMKVGSKWKLYIPSELAYGEQGRPGIPPNSVLTFEVELLGIGGGAASAPGAPPSGHKKPGK